jgi:hypothetical protein
VEIYYHAFIKAFCDIITISMVLLDWIGFVVFTIGFRIFSTQSHGV